MHGRPRWYTWMVMTAMFLLIILGAMSRRAPQAFAPLATGSLSRCHLISCGAPSVPQLAFLHGLFQIPV